MASAGAKTRGFGAKINAVLGSIGKLSSKIGSASMKMLGLGNAFGFAGRSSATLITRFATLASKIGLMYAALFPLIRLFHAFKKLTGLASQLTEIQNVVDVTFGSARNKVEEFTKTSIKQFGLSEISAKKFASQYQAMGKAMGITNQQVKDATGFLQKFKTPLGDTAGYDKASASMADMSLNLTKLTADMASFYNVDQQKVATALQSGVMAGNTRPLRQYGLDLTQATLSEWAMKNGLDANVKSMTQAQKAMLRYQYVMANAANAQGDFARTSGTWANQVRILKQQFQQLGTIIGKGLVNAFRPFLRSLNQILSKVISFAEQVFNSLGQIFGWKLTINAAGVTDDLEDASEAASDAEDSSGGAADNLGSAADNAKKLNKQLQGFDKLNNLTTSDSGSGGSGGSGGGGGSGGSGGGGLGGEANDVAVQLTETESLIESSLDSLYKLGEWIGKKLTDAMNSIPWNDVYKGAENFGKGLAEFLNGLISPELFSALGRTIANCINTELHFLDGFGSTFDWTDFGKSIGAGLNAFFGNIDWGLYIKVNATFGKGIANAFNAAVDETQFEFIGKAIVGYVTGAITKSYAMGVTIDLPKFGEKIADAVNEVIQNAPFYLAGATINVWTTGIYDGLTAAISNIKWEQIPKQISRFIDGLKLGEIGESWGKFSKSIVDALYDLVSDENAWHSIGTGIGDAISGALKGFGTGGWEKFGSSIANFCDGLITIIDDAITGVEWDGLGEGIAKGISKALKDFDWGNLGKTIIDIDVAIYDLINGLIDGIDWAGVPMSIIKGIGKALKESDWSGLFEGIGKLPLSPLAIGKDVADSYIDAIKKIDWSPVTTALKNAWDTAVKGLDLGLSFADNLLKDADKGIEIGIKFVADLIGPYWEDLKKFGSGAFKITANLAGSAWGTIKDVASGFAKIASKKAYTFKAVASGAWKTLKGYVKNPIGKIKDKIANYTAKAKGRWAWLVERAKDLKTYIRNRAATFTATAKGKWSTIANSARQVYNSLRSKTATFTARAGGKWNTIKETLSKVASSFYSKTVTMTLRFVTSGWEYVSSKWKQFKQWLAGKAEGGVLSNGKWKPIQGYASGGMPSSGQLFQARESGPELVGTIGGHTGVMNNDQIVASVSNGVAKAMAESNAILRQQNRILTNILAKEFGISSKDIFNAVRSENQNYMNRTGNNAFAL